MFRQRIRARSSLVGKAAPLILAVILAAALLWYGLMTLLLAFGLKSDIVNTISGYRTIFDFLTGLGGDDFGGATRAIMAAVGLLSFLVFGYLALKALPTPYLARQDLDLLSDERGVVVVGARAIERLAESSSSSHPAVASATARATSDRLELDVGLLRGDSLGTDLEEIRDRVRTALSDHQLPPRPVDVTLVGFDPPQRRELS